MSFLEDRVSDVPTLLLASRGTIARCALECLRDLVLTQGGLHLDFVPANPDIQALTDTLVKLQGRDIQQIVAIGGGSAIDLAKAVSALHGRMKDLSYELVEQTIVQKTYLTFGGHLPICAVPTTAGTGSEMTQWATIWDQQKKQKHSIDHPALLPKYAVAVPEYTKTMDAGLTLSTGLDALSHAMEAFWSRARNPLSQALSMSATKDIHHFLPLVLTNQDNKEFRRAMNVASLTAGAAFSMTRTTACHSISYPLTLLHGIPHGIAVAITLAEVAHKNLPAVPEIETLLEPFNGLFGFEQWLQNVTVGIGGLDLHRFGISKAEIPAIVDSAFTLGRMNNNPVILSKDEVTNILQRRL